VLLQFVNADHDDKGRCPARWGSVMILANRLFGFLVFALGLLATALIVAAML
jgi:hypothetical protein